MSFDFRKILYLNLKHYGTKIVHNALKKTGQFYDNKICTELNDIVIYEYLRQYFYENNVYNFNDKLVDNFFDKISNVTHNVKQLIQSNSLVVYNKAFGYCNVIFHKDLLLVYPIRLKFNRYILKCNIIQTFPERQLDYKKKIGNIVIIYKKNSNVFNIKLDKGVISNITTLSKKRLIEISTKYLDINLSMSLSTKEILDIIISNINN